MDRGTAFKERIGAEASEWIVRLHEEDPSASVRAEFVEWLLRSPDHVGEFLAISRVWGETQTAGKNHFPIEELIAQAKQHHALDNIVALEAVRQSDPLAGNEPDRDRAVRGRRIAAAAAIATLALSTIVWFVASHWSNPETFRTAIGEQRSITLPDGSIVDINTNSELRVSFEGQERRMQLVRGEARFKVAKDPQRPFIVVTPQARIRALGTIFNVRAESAQTAVAVIEGRVDVREAGTSEQRQQAVAHIELNAGQQAAVNPGGQIVPDAGPPIERVAEWTNRRLVFREEPLTVVIDEFNRYHRKPIRIAASELTDVRISGTFDSSDTNSLLEYFQRFEGVSVEHDKEGIWLSTPGASSQR